MSPSAKIAPIALAVAHLSACGAVPDRSVGSGVPTNPFASNYASEAAGASPAERRRDAEAARRSALTPPRALAP